MEVKVKEYKNEIEKESNKMEESEDIANTDNRKDNTDTIQQNADKREDELSNNAIISDPEIILKDGNYHSLGEAKEEIATSSGTKELKNTVVPSASDEKAEAENLNNGKDNSVRSQVEVDASQSVTYVAKGDRDVNIKPCVVCLGILQNFCSEKYLNKVNKVSTSCCFKQST